MNIIKFVLSTSVFGKVNLHKYNHKLKKGINFLIHVDDGFTNQ